jgi:hypothetical protein
MNEYLDLVDEMQWEDSDKVEFISLESAGLENADYDTVPFAQRQELEDWEI